ncbi:heavy metal-responsive transcriptional regulator [Stenotrophomonas sp. 169]|uniref:heavy metal-responsive transcriptional regulator n=1 Tax=unclassified Stenotrophomonas TaxID=196198 RepID=UPI0016625DA8|nr:heavy metal-responsive transcriptional regulator [Stenotrophomonas sp. 169]QNR98886.1 heavy metal-responsive transcriptional regulator [Stenotrophomonas sp. 169]
MNIGQLARHVGVPIDTVRYYERQQLLPPVHRSAAGYRVFDENAVQRLRFIRRAKTLGFTLQEIAELLSLSARAPQDMAAVRLAATARLADIDQRVRELQRMREGLAHLVDACPGHGALAACPIMAALQEDPA